MMHPKSCGKAYSIAALGFSLLFAIPLTSAETIEVGGGCSLSDAIRSANANTAHGGCTAGDPGQDIASVNGTVEVEEYTSIPSVLDDLVLVGDGPTSVVDANGNALFSVNKEVNVYIQDLVLTHAFGPDPTGHILVERGGSIYFQNSHTTNCNGRTDIVTQEDARVEIDRNSSVCGTAGTSDPLPRFWARVPTTRKGGKRSSASRAARPVVYTCETLPPDIVVRPVAGTRSGIQCQMLDGGGVGRQDILDMGVIVAVDIWGNAAPGVEVCLPGDGKLLFLDAAFSPRQASWIA